MDVARRGEGGGFVEDVAGAIAAAARRRPIAAALVAVGIPAAVFAGHLAHPALGLAWILAATFVAGAALAGRTPVERWTWTFDRCAIAALAVVVAVGAIDLSVQEIESSAPFAVFGVAFLVGALRSNLFVATAAVALAALALAPLAMPADAEAPWYRSPPLSANWLPLLALLVAARHGRWTSVVALAVAAIALLGVFRWDVWTLHDPAWVHVVGMCVAVESAQSGLILTMLLLVVAGRIAAHPADDRRDGVARLAARMRREPWSLALTVIVAGLALFSTDGGPYYGQLLVAIATMACLAHCVVGPSPALGWLAPWIVAAALCMPLAMGIWLPFGEYFRWPKDGVETYVPRAATLLVAPLVVGLVVTRARTTRFPWWGWVTLIAVAAIAVANRDRGLYGSWMADDATWCVLASLLVHAVATSAVSARVVFALSPIVSFVLIDGFYLVRAFDPMETHIHGPEIVASFVAGPVAALLALVARRVRSPAATPPDLAPLAPLSAHPGFPEAPRPL